MSTRPAARLAAAASTAARPRRSRRPWLRLASAAVTCAAVAALVVATRRHAPDGLEIVTGQGGRMLTVPGRPVLLKAVPPEAKGHALRYRWELEDGSPAVEGKVENPHAISLSRDLGRLEAGSIVRGHIDVTDESTGQVRRGGFEVAVVEKTPENERTIAIDDGLWALQASQEPDDRIPGVSMSRWERPITPATAVAVLAFEVNGHDGREGREASAYRATVERGIDELTSSLERFETSKGGHGISIAGHEAENYTLPLIAMALVASQAPEAVARTGPEGVRGRARRELVQEMLAWLAFSRTTAQDWAKGGWRYRVGCTDADLSVTQWPALAFLSAQEVWGLEAPADVRQELEGGFLKATQQASGGFGYQNRGGESLRMTAAGILGLRFAGAGEDDARIQSAWRFIEKTWASEGKRDGYGMYGLMKAARLAGRERIGGHDWTAEYADFYFGCQNKDGSWDGHGGWDWQTFRTAFPVLTLSKDVFAAARPVTVWDVLRRAAPVVAPAIVLALAAFRFRRRRAHPIMPA